MFIPGDASRAKKIKLSYGKYKILRFALVAFLFFALVSVVDYGAMSVRVAELGKIKNENNAQKAELRSFASKISELETQLSKLQLFDKKLRIIANLEDVAPTVENQLGMGMGGASNEDEYFLTTSDKRDVLLERMHTDLEQLETEAFSQERSFTELQEHLFTQSSMLASTPSVWPVRGWTTSLFGKRRDPFTGRTKHHSGMDIANRAGTHIKSPGDGIVTRVTRLPSLGKLVEVSHGYGLKTRYGHLSEAFVKVGQKVVRGEKLAAMGSTGRSTGPHLHYEIVLNGVNVDPVRYILD